MLDDSYLIRPPAVPASADPEEVSPLPPAKLRGRRMWSTNHIEFWRMKRVAAVTGLSRSDIYRRLEEGRFPRPRKYRDSHMIFWPSTEIIAWQREQIGEEFEQLLIAAAINVA